MTASTTTENGQAPRLPVIATATLVAVIAVISFGMSAAAMTDLMARAGFAAYVAWGLPAIVDGTIVAAMVTLFVRRGEDDAASGDRKVAWWLLGGFAIVSVLCNGVHTIVIFDPSQGIDLRFAIFLGMLPPIALLGSSDLLVRLLAAASSRDEAAGSEVVSPAPEPVATVIAAEPERFAVPVAASDVLITAGDETSEPVAAAGEPLATSAAAAVLEDSAVATEEPSRVASGEEGVTGGEDPFAAAEATGNSPRLHAVEPVVELPTEPAEQVAWVVERAQAGHDVTWKAVAADLGLSGRQAQRRVTEARKQDPAAFAA